MNGLATLTSMNTTAALRAYMRKKPLVHVLKPSDAMQSEDYSGVDLSLLEKASDCRIVDTMFVDSLGLDLNDAGGPALSLNAFTGRVQALLDVAKQANCPVYSCLSGVGQFQVYVTFLTPTSKPPLEWDK